MNRCDREQRARGLARCSRWRLIGKSAISVFVTKGARAISLDDYDPDIPLARPLVDVLESRKTPCSDREKPFDIHLLKKFLQAAFNLADPSLIERMSRHRLW